ncbi:unnamed protein product [Nippostrongylus brasiliensis]|uniref:ELMO domain-containing protein n=1 Tax=Nippostrongylus brasiliensis TaxID=27835 RepID=A0A0N4YH12_NIPBR|nr:unnamed protein product [Nippostrongylus brasiliensis]
MLIAQLVIVWFKAFIHEWHLLHGEGLTRHRRACFDVFTALETYQTRARSMGHLFQPDPPTPLVTFLPDGTAASGCHEANDVKTPFMEQRDAHYANMFQFAMQMNKEMEAMVKANESSERKVQYLLRLVMKDLRFNAGVKHILEGLHPSAYEAFQNCRDLAEIVERQDSS